MSNRARKPSHLKELSGEGGRRKQQVNASNDPFGAYTDEDDSAATPAAPPLLTSRGNKKQQQQQQQSSINSGNRQHRGNNKQRHAREYSTDGGGVSDDGAGFGTSRSSSYHGRQQFLPPADEQQYQQQPQQQQQQFYSHRSLQEAAYYNSSPPPDSALFFFLRPFSHLVQSGSFKSLVPEPVSHPATQLRSLLTLACCISDTSVLLVTDELDDPAAGQQRPSSSAGAAAASSSTGEGVGGAGAGRGSRRRDSLPNNTNKNASQRSSANNVIVDDDDEIVQNPDRISQADQERQRQLFSSPFDHSNVAFALERSIPPGVCPFYCALDDASGPSRLREFLGSVDRAVESGVSFASVTKTDAFDRQQQREAAAADANKNNKKRGTAAAAAADFTGGGGGILFGNEGGSILSNGDSEPGSPVAPLPPKEVEVDYTRYPRAERTTPLLLVFTFGGICDCAEWLLSDALQRLPTALHEVFDVVRSRRAMGQGRHGATITTALLIPGRLYMHLSLEQRMLFTFSFSLPRHAFWPVHVMNTHLWHYPVSNSAFEFLTRQPEAVVSHPHQHHQQQQHHHTGRQQPPLYNGDRRRTNTRSTNNNSKGKMKLDPKQQATSSSRRGGSAAGSKNRRGSPNARPTFSGSSNSKRRGQNDDDNNFFSEEEYSSSSSNSSSGEGEAHGTNAAAAALERHMATINAGDQFGADTLFASLRAASASRRNNSDENLDDQDNSNHAPTLTAANLIHHHQALAAAVSGSGSNSLESSQQKSPTSASKKEKKKSHRPLTMSLATASRIIAENNQRLAAGPATTAAAAAAASSVADPRALSVTAVAEAAEGAAAQAVAAPPRLTSEQLLQLQEHVRQLQEHHYDRLYRHSARHYFGAGGQLLEAGGEAGAFDNFSYGCRSRLFFGDSLDGVELTTGGVTGRPEDLGHGAADRGVRMALEQGHVVINGAIQRYLWDAIAWSTSFAHPIGGGGCSAFAPSWERLRVIFAAYALLFDAPVQRYQQQIGDNFSPSRGGGGGGGGGHDQQRSSSMDKKKPPVSSSSSHGRVLSAGTELLHAHMEGSTHFSPRNDADLAAFGGTYHHSPTQQQRLEHLSVPVPVTCDTLLSLLPHMMGHVFETDFVPLSGESDSSVVPTGSSLFSQQQQGVGIGGNRNQPSAGRREYRSGDDDSDSFAEGYSDADDDWKNDHLRKKRIVSPAVLPAMGSRLGGSGGIDATAATGGGSGKADTVNVRVNRLLRSLRQRNHPHHHRYSSTGTAHRQSSSSRGSGGGLFSSSGTPTYNQYGFQPGDFPHGNTAAMQRGAMLGVTPRAGTGAGPSSMQQQQQQQQQYFDGGRPSTSFGNSAASLDPLSYTMNDTVGTMMMQQQQQQHQQQQQIIGGGITAGSRNERASGGWETAEVEAPSIALSIHSYTHERVLSALQQFMQLKNPLC